MFFVYISDKLIFLFSLQIFLIGFLGLVAFQKNAIFALIAVEICLLASNILFVVSGILFYDLFGQIFALFILAIAAAESIIGLALIVLIFKIKGTVLLKFSDLLKE